MARAVKESSPDTRNADKTIKVLFEIANAVNHAVNLDELYREIHICLGKIINVDNFAIALYHREKDSLTYPYFVDEKDTDTGEIFNISKKSFYTARVINENRPLLVTHEEMLKKHIEQPGTTLGIASKILIGSPLRIRDRVFGALILQNYKFENTYKESDLDILISVSEFVAVAIERKQAEDEIKQTEKITQTLFLISNAVNTSDDLDDLYHLIHHSLNMLIELPNFFIALVDKEKKNMSFPFFIDEHDSQETIASGLENYEQSASLTNQVVQNKKPLFLTQERLEDNARQKQMIGTLPKIWLGVPLIIRDDVIGVMAMQHYSDPDYFRQKEMDLLISVSDQVALAIDRKKAQEEIRHNERITHTLFSISNAVNTTQDLSELYKSIHSSLNKIIDLTNFIIGLYNRKDNTISFEYYVDQYDDLQGESIPLGDGSLGSDVIHLGKPVFLNRKRLKEKSIKVQAIGTWAKTWMGVPLKADKEVIGYMAAQSYFDPDLFDQRDLEIFTIVSEQVALAIDRKRSQEEIKQNEKLTKTLFSISNAVNTTENLNDLYRSIHQSLGDIIDVSNFAIGIYDAHNDIISYPYYVDETGDVYQKIKNVSSSGILARDIIVSKQAVFSSRLQIIARAQNMGRRVVGSIPEQWLGFPLKIQDKVIGVIVVQHYQNPEYYTQKETDLLIAVSDQIALAIDRKRALEEIINSEKLTQTLFSISNAVNTTSNLDDLYQSIYDSLNILIDLPNFYISIIDQENHLMHFPFYLDECDGQDTTSFTVDYSKNKNYITFDVITSRKPLFLTRELLKKKEESRQITGTVPLIWLGVPLIIRDKVIGVMAVQHYTDPEYFTQKDMDLLISVSDQVALAIDRRQAQDIISKRERQIRDLSGQTEELSLVAASIITMKDDQKIFEYVSRAIVENSDYKKLIISYFTDYPPYREILGFEGITPENISNEKSRHVLKDDYRQIFSAGVKIGGFACYLPHTKRGSPGIELDLFSDKIKADPQDAWHPQDMLFLAMNDSDGNLMGIISLGDSKSGKKPTRETIRPLEIFSSLVSQIIIVRKIQNELNDHKDNLEKIVAGRTRELTAEIAERIEIEKRLKQAKIEAEAAAQAKIEFLANMSHEIRTPINGIMGMAEIAMENELNSELKTILETIDSETNQLLGIINEILDFSKIEAGKLSIDKIEFDLRHTFEQACSSLAIGADNKGIEFISFLPPDIPRYLMGDPGRLRQILVNLTSNAIKFTHEGEIFIKGELVTEDKTTVELRFSINDTGIGIAREKQNTIFDSFSQADGSTTRQYGGTGLGTTISKQLVDLMGGNIGLESEAKKGSTFWFTLLFDKQPKKEAPQDDIKGVKVLFIDGNSTSRYIFDQYLTSFGCEVSLARDPTEAMDILAKKKKEKTRVDVLIENDDMDGMSGFELARSIRASDAFKSLPIIMLTAIGKKAKTNLSIENSINGYLSKPVRKNELKQIIISALRKTKKTPGEANNHNAQYIPDIVPKKDLFILLVEDYPTNQKIAMNHLMQAGYQVTLAETGMEAFKAFKQQPFDLILMDIQMPEIDGYESTRLIRDHELKMSDTMPSPPKTRPAALTRIPIIAMTAHA
ncbi:MAG: GAF domain-containing protein, partial [Desulfobacteraceae bacterium]|nr:GAF domain-containing protein [Desulfobacteraceae bacterium]